MSMPIRLSSGLITEARVSGGRFHRSIPQQVEHWAFLGKTIEAALALPSIARLKDVSRTPQLDKVLARAESPAGRKKVQTMLAKSGVPYYTSDPAAPEIIIQHHGRRLERGRFEHGQFVASGFRA